MSENKKRFSNLLLVLRWVAVLPGSLVAGILANFPLHWILYWTFVRGEVVTGMNIEPIERTLAPFVISITYMLVGFWIAPRNKFRTCIILCFLWVGVFIGFFVLMPEKQLRLQASSVGSLLGVSLGLFVAWKKSRQAHMNKKSLSQFVFDECEKSGAVNVVGKGYYEHFIGMNDEQMISMLKLIYSNCANDINRIAFEVNLSDESKENKIVKLIETNLSLIALGILAFNERGESLLFKPLGPDPDIEMKEKIDAKIKCVLGMAHKALTMMPVNGNPTDV